MSPVFIKNGSGSGSWKNIVNIFIKNGSGNGSFKNVLSGFIRVGNAWKQFFSSSLSIAQQVTISQSTNATTFLTTLTGTNYYWSPGPPVLTYKFQRSTDNFSTWSDLDSGSIVNPAFGSSNTKTYLLPSTGPSVGVLPNILNYYRFKVDATYGSLTAESISSSTTIQGPTNVTIGLASPTFASIQLSWTASTGANRYLVYKSTDNITFSQYASVTSTSLSGIFDLAGGATYYFYVVPITGGSFTYPGYLGNNSNTLVLPILATPTLSAATSNSSGFSFTINNYDASNTYTLSTTSGSISISGSTVTVSGLSPGQSATATVSASRSGYGDSASASRTGSALQLQPTASGFAVSDVTATPSNPSVISFSSSNNQVTSTWTNGSPITSVTYTLSGAGTNASLTDTTAPFVTSDLTAYSQSGTYTFTVTNFNNNFVVRVSWNQTNTQSYIIYYSGSSSGAASLSGNSSASSVSVDIPWSSANGSFTFTNLNVYTLTNQTGNSASYSTGLSAISPSVKLSSRSDSTFLTYTPPAPVNTSIPTLSPTSIFVGTTLTAGVGTWSNSPTSYDIRIYRGTAGVIMSETLVASGTSTSLTYTVTQADYNSGQLYFRTYVNATNAGGSSGFVAGQERGPIQISAPSNTSAPSVSPSSGTAGSTQFSCTTGSWTNSPTSYAYQWQYLDQGTTYLSISGATSSTYTPPSNYVSLYGSSLRCRVTASNSGGSGTANSNVVTVSTGGSAPATPTGVTNTYNGGTSYTFSWTASSGATSYNINYGENTTAPSPNPPSSIVGNVTTGTVNTSSTSYSYTSSSSSNYVGFRVRANNSNGSSSYSAVTQYK